jgi:hypothetical protein
MCQYEISRHGGVMGRRRERRRQDDRTADRIAMALEMVRRSDEHWHGLVIALRAERTAQNERYRAEAMASRRRES